MPAAATGVAQIRGSRRLRAPRLCAGRKVTLGPSGASRPPFDSGTGVSLRERPASGSLISWPVGIAWVTGWSGASGSTNIVGRDYAVGYSEFVSLADSGNFVGDPAFGVYVWTILVWLVVLGLLAGAPVTAAKDRWRWLLAGLLTGAPLLLFTAWLLAAPDSRWARRFYGPEKMARAGQHFGHARTQP